MPDVEEHAGIRWLAVFEQSASLLLFALAVGSLATYMTVSRTEDQVKRLVLRLDSLEQKTDVRMQKVESDLTSLKIAVARLEREEEKQR